MFTAIILTNCCWWRELRQAGNTLTHTHTHMTHTHTHTQSIMIFQFRQPSHAELWEMYLSRLAFLFSHHWYSQTVTGRGHVNFEIWCTVKQATIATLYALFSSPFINALKFSAITYSTTNLKNEETNLQKPIFKCMINPPLCKRCTPWVSNPRPPAIFVNYVDTYYKKLYNNLGGQVYHLLLSFHVRPTKQPTITGVAPCHIKVSGQGSPQGMSRWMQSSHAIKLTHPETR